MTAGPLSYFASFMVREGSRAPGIGDVLQIVASSPDGVLQAEWLTTGAVLQFTTATRPLPSSLPFTLIFKTDDGPNGNLQFSNGTNWLNMAGVIT